MMKEDDDDESEKADKQKEIAKANAESVAMNEAKNAEAAREAAA